MKHIEFKDEADKKLYTWIFRPVCESCQDDQGIGLYTIDGRTDGQGNSTGVPLCGECHERITREQEGKSMASEFITAIMEWWEVAEIGRVPHITIHECLWDKKGKYYVKYEVKPERITTNATRGNGPLR